MERLIGRKKIEEIRISQKVLLTETEGSAIMVPNFYFENIGCYMKDSLSFMEEIPFNNSLLKLLTFFNEFCPSAHFEFQVGPINKLLSIYFGNVYLEILMPKDFRNKTSINVYVFDRHIKNTKFSGDLDKFDLTRFRKSDYFKESSEYQTLVKELQKQYKIKEA